MNTVISLQSDTSHYTADAVMIWCFDDRFSKLLDAVIKQQKFEHVDLIKVAGGSKGLAMPEGDVERNFVLGQIAKSIKLHHTKKIILMMHSECGAYAGSIDPDFYRAELVKAKALVRNRFPHLQIQALYADFAGLSEI